MFLKSLSIKGFKSFADATSLQMEPGVTVVVGPNGSGKSNVVDAIGWVLGAQAPSAVRSQKMDDVIFAGTTKRPALGRAEVALTIDNSSGMLPIEFTEVTITAHAVPQRRQRVRHQRRAVPPARHPGAALRHRRRSPAARDHLPGPDRRGAQRPARGAAADHRGGRRGAQVPAAQGEGRAPARLHRGQPHPGPGPAPRGAAPAPAARDARPRPPAVTAPWSPSSPRSGSTWPAGDRPAPGSRRVGRAHPHRAAGDASATLRTALAELDTRVLTTETELHGHGRPRPRRHARALRVAAREGARGWRRSLTERRRGVERERDATVDRAVIATLEAEAARLADELAAAEREAAELEPASTGAGRGRPRSWPRRARPSRHDWADGVALPSGQAAEVRGELAALRAAVERGRGEAERVGERLDTLQQKAERLGAEADRLRAELADAEQRAPGLAARRARRRAGAGRGGCSRAGRRRGPARRRRRAPLVVGPCRRAVARRSTRPAPKPARNGWPASTGSSAPCSTWCPSTRAGRRRSRLPPARPSPRWSWPTSAAARTALAAPARPRPERRGARARRGHRAALRTPATRLGAPARPLGPARRVRSARRARRSRRGRRLVGRGRRRGPGRAGPRRGHPIGRPVRAHGLAGRHGRLRRHRCRARRGTGAGGQAAEAAQAAAQVARAARAAHDAAQQAEREADPGRRAGRVPTACRVRCGEAGRGRPRRQRGRGRVPPPARHRAGPARRHRRGPGRRPGPAAARARGRGDRAGRPGAGHERGPQPARGACRRGRRAALRPRGPLGRPRRPPPVPRSAVSARSRSGSPATSPSARPPKVAGSSSTARRWRSTAWPGSSRHASSWSRPRSPRLREQRRLQTDAARQVALVLEELRKERTAAEADLESVREQAAPLRARRHRGPAAPRAGGRDAAPRPRLRARGRASRPRSPSCPRAWRPPARVRELERDLRLMGPINPLALEEFEAMQRAARVPRGPARGRAQTAAASSPR